MSYLISRRERLLDAMQDNSVGIIFSGVSKITSEDECFPFVVNKDFFYLTDIKQENSILVFIKSVNGNHVYLFVEEYDELKEKWTGKRLTFDEARTISQIDAVFAVNNFEGMFNLFFAKENNQYGNINTLYINQGVELKIADNKTIECYIHECEKNPILEGVQIVNFKPLITSLREIKQEEEIEFLRHAIANTNQGILDLLTFIKPGMFEYEVSDHFEFFERKNFREGLAFSTIAAGRSNAVVLHYPQQQDKLKDGDLVLLDLGYKYHGYSADISRTYPINGKYNELQRKIYQVVLDCNKAVIEYARSGLTLKDLQEFCINFLKENAIKAGIMDKDDDIRKYYYHGVSHHLGLDTHDVCDRSKPLVPGNVITVEPGLYFKQYGIGVRIEDDVLITDSQSIVLSKDIKKEIDDIEALFRTIK